MESPKTHPFWHWLLFLAYAVLVFSGLLRHEIWMDEAHHWLIPRDSPSFFDLLKNLRYEGHPGLWNVLLYGLAVVGREVWMMQLLHGTIAIGTMYWVVFKSPFPLWVKALLPFGYFTLFEYALISRNYALAFLLAFTIVQSIKRENLSLVSLALLFALLANTHLLGFCLSLLLLLYVPYKKGDAIWGPLLIYLVGLGLAVLQIIPPGDHPMVTGLDAARLFSWESIKKAILVFNEAFLPVHDFQRHHFWHTNWLETQHIDTARALSILLGLLPLWFFRNRPKSWLVFYGMAGAVLLLSALKGVNYERFHGFLFMTFFLLLWLEYANLQPFQNKKGRVIFVGLMLIVQLVGGLHAYVQDWRFPFSESKNVAQFLQAEEYQGLPVIGGYCFGESLQAYLPQSLHYPEQAGESFCRWEIFDDNYLKELQTEDYYSRLLRYFIPYESPQAILVSHQPLDLSEKPLIRTYNAQPYQLRLDPLPPFTNNLKQMEAYYLYHLQVISSAGE